MKFGAAVEQVVDYAHPAADSGIITVAAGAFNLLVSIEDPPLEREIRCQDRLAAARGRQDHVVTASRYRTYPIACARIGFRPPMSSYDHFRDHPPVLPIVAPRYSAYIVSGDTIFEQRLVGVPTATVRQRTSIPPSS